MGPSLRSILPALALLVLAAQAADAAFISTSPDPMLGGDLVTTGAPISSPFGFATFTITDIAQTSNIISGGNNLITYTASPILSFYSDATLTNLLTTATLQGEFVIKVLGRTTPFQTGTFAFEFVSSTATGLVGGDTVTVQLDPNQTSFGSTTITPGPGLGEFTIHTTATQYSQFSINGGRFTNVSPIQLVGVATVPEPSSLSMIAVALAGLGLAYRRFA